jgi:c-di-GMP-binding flagellar brake protein YcgR
MRFDELPERTADNRVEGEAGKQDPGDDTNDPIKIPLKIDEGIVVRSLTNTAHIAKARIIGAKVGEYILITEPTVRINERVAAVLDEGFLCSYFSDGNLYIFKSRYRRYLGEDVMCIEYPRDVEVRQIRKDRRIRVNIETKLVVSDTTDSFLVDLADISRGGCRVVVNQRRIPIEKGTNLSLTFSLPNEAFINALQAVAVRISRIKDSVTTEIGLTFTGPESELSKIANFCEFCMFFDLE